MTGAPSAAPCGETEEHGPHDYSDISPGDVPKSVYVYHMRCPGNLPETPKEIIVAKCKVTCPSCGIVDTPAQATKTSNPSIVFECGPTPTATTVELFCICGHTWEVPAGPLRGDETPKKPAKCTACPWTADSAEVPSLPKALDHINTAHAEIRSRVGELERMTVQCSTVMNERDEALKQRDEARAEVEIYRVVLADAVDHLMDGHDWDGSYGERTLLSAWLEAVWKAWHDQRPLKNPKDPDFMERLPSMTKREGP